MLDNKEKILHITDLVCRNKFLSCTLSVYKFTGTVLTQKEIDDLMRLKQTSNLLRKMTKLVFSDIKQYFRNEPLICSHLMIGNNIFCFKHGGKKKLINLKFSGESAITEKSVVKEFRPPLTEETYFWLFTQIEISADSVKEREVTM